MPVSLLSRILGNRDRDREAVRPLWHRVVALARDPAWFDRHGIADTVPGRFDAITLVLALLLLRMERDPALIPPSVRLTELFVDDMDGQLRQAGVGDLVVGKHIGKLMSVLGGRLGALREAVPQGACAVGTVLERNITLRDGTGADGLAAATLAMAARFDALSSDAILDARL